MHVSTSVLALSALAALACAAPAPIPAPKNVFRPNRVPGLGLPPPGADGHYLWPPANLHPESSAQLAVEAVIAAAGGYEQFTRGGGHAIDKPDKVDKVDKVDAVDRF